MDHQGRPAVRILVVEDHEPFRRYFCSTLEQRADFQVIGQASNGLEAIEKAQALQPDLILLDVGLPNVNGLEAARHVRKLAPHAKILFISQEFSFDMVEAALRLGASGYVHKLRVQNDFSPAIESVLRGKYFVSGVIRGAFGEVTTDTLAIRHEVQFCSDDAICVQRFTDFTASTMKAGRAAIVIATESHRSAVLQELGTRKWDVDSAIRRGILRPLDVTEKLSASLLNERLDPASFFDLAGDLIEDAASAAEREHAPRVGVCRECPPALFKNRDIGHVLRLEQLWGLVAHTSVLHLLCVYSSANLKNQENMFERIRAEHSAVYSG
jgi:DNA-binding NarL/FixJ family response regulator